MNQIAKFVFWSIFLLLFLSCEHNKKKQLPPIEANLRGPIGGDTIFYEGEERTGDKLFELKIKNTQVKNNLYFFGNYDSSSIEVSPSLIEFIRSIGDSIVSTVGIPEYWSHDTIVIRPGESQLAYAKIHFFPEFDTLVLHFEYSTDINSIKTKWLKLKYLIQDDKVTRKIIKR
jgi:hypothetical protein